jgi:ribosomal protein S6E (S10)
MLRSGASAEAVRQGGNALLPAQRRLLVRFSPDVYAALHGIRERMSVRGRGMKFSV